MCAHRVGRQQAEGEAAGRKVWSIQEDVRLVAGTNSLYMDGSADEIASRLDIYPAPIARGRSAVR